MAPRGRISRQPSPYPRALFHLIRVAQLVVSTAILAFVGFFVHYLIEDSYYIPWTFLMLLGVSGFTDLSVIGTAYFYHYRVLRPRLSSVINGVLSVIWLVALALLSWNLSGTLTNSCDVDNWSHDTGIMVCRIYKAMEAFTVAGFVLTLSSLALDLFTVRKTQKRGFYNQMDETKRPIVHARAVSNVNEDFSSEDHAHEPGLSRGFREPSLEIPDYAHDQRQPYKPQLEVQAERFGYSVPQEQTTYEGAGARALDSRFREMGA